MKELVNLINNFPFSFDRSFIVVEIYHFKILYKSAGVPHFDFTGYARRKSRMGSRKPLL